MFTRRRLAAVLLVLTALLAVLGGGLFVTGGGLAVVNAMEGKRTRWTAPGQLTLELEPGTWDVSQEVAGGPGTDVEVPPLPADLTLHVHGPAGRPVSVRPPRGTSTYASGDVSGQVRFVFEIEEPGAYELVATGGAGTRLAVGRDALGLAAVPFVLLVAAVLLLAGVPTLGLVGLVLWVVRE